MTKATERTSTKTRRTRESEPTLDGHGPQDLVGDRDRDDINERDGRTERGEQYSRDQQSEQHDVEQLTDRARAVASRPADAVAEAPDMSKVVTAWFDMAENMMKLQHQFFAAMVNAGNTDDRPTTQPGA